MAILHRCALCIVFIIFLTAFDAPVKYYYDNNQRLERIQNAVNQNLYYQYDFNGNLIKRTDQRPGAIIFDGVDDAVLLGSLGARPQQGTIEFWMNSSDVADYRNPLSTNGGNVGIRFEQSASGHSFAVVIGDDLGSYTVHEYRGNNDPLTPGTWYHVALAWDSSQNQVWGYLNGDLVFARTQTHWNTHFSELTIGTGFDGSPARSFKGKIRDVRVWHVARIAAQINGGLYVISSNEAGLAGRWLMNEGFGRTVYEHSGQGGHGVISGAAWVTEPQQSLYFDGASDTVSLGSIGPRPPQGTIEFWMNSQEIADHRNPLSTGPGNAGIRFEQSTAGDSLAVVIGNDFGQYSTHAYRHSGNPLIAGTWYHVALVWDEFQAEVRGYLDGELVFHSPQTYWSTSLNLVTLGNGYDGSPSRFFKGKLRDVRIWNIARSAGQIAEGMNAVQSNAVGLTGRWLMNEGTGLVVHESSGKGMNGTISGAVWIVETEQALSFDGVSNQVRVDYFGQWPAQGTLEFRMNSADVSDYRNPLSVHAGNTGIRFEQSASGDSLSVTIGNDVGEYSTHAYRTYINPIESGTWYHIALTWDSLQNKVWGYMDGQLVFANTQTYWPSQFQQLMLGSGFDMSPARSFKGMLQDVRVWNIAKSEARLKEEMTSISVHETGLMGRWLLNEGFGVTAYDHSGAGKHGTISGAVWIPTLQRALRFHGEADKVTMGTLGARSEQGTLEFWMNSSDVANYRNPLSTNGGNIGIRFEQSGAGDFLAVIGDDGGNYSVHSYRNSSNPLLSGNWYHVALSWDSTQNKVWGYLNGQLIFEQAQTYWNTSFDQVILGNGLDLSPARAFQGKLRDVRLWNVVKTEQQVNEEMDAVSSNHPNLLHRWLLDEGFGSSAVDSTLNGKHGVITGALWD